MKGKHYRIRVAQRMGAGLRSGFPELSLTEDGGDSILSGQPADQDALHDVLGRIRDLGLTRISVETLADTCEHDPNHTN